MKPPASILRFALFVLLLTACGEQTSIPTSPNPVTASATPFPSDPTLAPVTDDPIAKSTTAPATATASPPSPTPSPTQPINEIPHYELTAELDYYQHRLSVEERITYPNNSSEPIPDLVLIIEPARYPGVFQLNRIAWGAGEAMLDYTREIGYLHIPLEQPLGPDESVELIISYDLFLPSPSPSYYGRPVPFGYSSRQTNLVDWYPFIPPYVTGQGWLVHDAGSFGEHLVYESADFEVNIHLSDSQTPLVIAASAPARVEDGWHHYKMEAARNFVWSVSDQYVMTTTTVDSIAVLGYYFAANARAGEAALQATAEALGLYNDLYGPYPRQSLSVVEADFLDGMEYDGLFFLSKGFYNLYSGGPADYLTAIAVHETAHQWWYSAVANDQALEPWLDEALSTYSERLYYERIHPQGLDWWWTYRIHYYQPRGWVDGSIYNPEGYLAYRDAIYLNGALFLEDLRELLGDESFFPLLRSYSDKYTRQIVTADNFFALLGDFSQEDITPLLDKYFQHR
jgi:hypothetical protein